MAEKHVPRGDRGSDGGRRSSANSPLPRATRIREARCPGTRVSGRSRLSDRTRPLPEGPVSFSEEIVSKTRCGAAFEPDSRLFRSIREGSWRNADPVRQV
jgi:hypothetical protein